MQVFPQIAALAILLFVVQALLRRAGKWVLWSLFLILPAVLTPFWLSANDVGLFVWIKVYTMMGCIGWMGALRFTSLGHRSWAIRTVPILLAVNILEATILDMLGHGLAHAINAAAGVLLIATQQYGSNAATFDASRARRDMHYGLSRYWIVGYTLWNWTFVVNNYAQFAGYQTAVLLSALIVGILRPQLWLQARALTLGISLFSSASFNSEMISWLDTSNWSHEGLGIPASGFALAIMSGLFLRSAFPALLTIRELWASSPSNRLTLATH